MLIAALSGIAAFLLLRVLLFAIARRRRLNRAARRPPPAPAGWRPNYAKVRRIERQLAAASRTSAQKTAEE